MKKSLFNPIFKFASSVTFIVSSVLLCMNPISCKMSEETIDVAEAKSSPVIQSYEVTTSSNVSVVFSKEVNVVDAKLFFDDSKDSLSVSYDGALQENSYHVNFAFPQELEVGKSYELYGEVEDLEGNSLTFNLPFVGYNNDIASLEMTEVHPKYAKITSGFKCEYVEFVVRSSGNLSGLEIVSGYDGEDKKYTFPAVQVNEGDFIVVHLRSKGEGCVSELSDNLKLSSGKYSSDSARDLWAANEDARLGDESDVVVLRKVSNGEILDAVLYATSETTEWKKDLQKELATKVVESKKWEPDSSVTSVAIIDGITAAKSLVKNAKDNCATSWSVTESSAETPGY